MLGSVSFGFHSHIGRSYLAHQFFEQWVVGAEISLDEGLCLIVFTYCIFECVELLKGTRLRLESLHMQIDLTQIEVVQSLFLTLASGRIPRRTGWLLQLFDERLDALLTGLDRKFSIFKRLWMLTQVCVSIGDVEA